MMVCFALWKSVAGIELFLFHFTMIVALAIGLYLFDTFLVN